MRFHAHFATIGLTILLSACAGSPPVASPDATAAPDSSASSAADDHDGHGDMTMEEDLPFDALFIDDMILHHQGAIEMAEAVLEEAEHEELRTMADAIISAQTSEIEQMQQWRAEWYPDLPATEGMQMDMGDMVISDDPDKPFDQRFLEAMISHHEGALHMAELALEQAEREEIRSLAETIIAAQQAEIEQMQSWLDEWYGDGATSSLAPSPYADELSTPVRGLTAAEVDDLLNGRGMGFARMAELNNYPGPLHLLDLQAALALQPEQINQIEQSFQRMQAEAQTLGREIVLQEQVLSDAFAAGTIDNATLKSQVGLLGGYYGQLRNVHLQAHLEVTALLTTEQIAHYNALRGYTEDAMEHHRH